MNALRGFASLRTRENAPYIAPKKDYGECDLCDKKLNQWSPAPLCFNCDEEHGPKPTAHIQCANKLSQEQRNIIWREWLDGATQYGLAKTYGVSRSSIQCEIKKRYQGR